MGKVTIRPMAKPDDPIYQQPVQIGARFTGKTQKKPPEKEPLDLQNLPFDPAQAAGEASLALTEGKPRDKKK